MNADGRQTLTNYQLRVNSAGNIVASPRDGKLYLVFADNRGGSHDVGNPTTNTNVYVMTSTNGSSWSGPFVVNTGAGDQWFPWVDVDPTSSTGKIGVLYNDRTGNVYGASLSEGLPGAFAKTVVSTQVSHPRESAFFQAEIPGCETCGRSTAITSASPTDPMGRRISPGPTCATRTPQRRVVRPVHLLRPEDRTCHERGRRLPAPLDVAATLRALD